MHQTGSNHFICDGLKLQHTAEVIDFLDDNDITMSDSHCFMQFDYRMFAPYQKEVSLICYLYDNIKSIWETDKFIDLATKTINDYPRVCREVIRRYL